MAQVFAGSIYGKQALAEMGIVTFVSTRSATKLAEALTRLPQAAVA